MDAREELAIAVEYPAYAIRRDASDNTLLIDREITTLNNGHLITKPYFSTLHY